MFTDEMIATIAEKMFDIEKAAYDDITVEQVAVAVRSWLEAVAETLTESPAWYLYGPSMDGCIRPGAYEKALDKARKVPV